MTPGSFEEDGDKANPPRRRLEINPEALRLVPAGRREFWEKLASEAEIGVAERFRKRWTSVETVRLVLASPIESYEEVARELNRSPGAVRYRRMAMIHLLRDEHGAMDRVTAYRSDPKVHHKHADYAQVAEVLEGLGYFDLPVREQFAIAVPLGQPSNSWRGDGSAAALAMRKSESKVLRDEASRLLQSSRVASEDARNADDAG